ncbi:hypothetical protein [Streptomyces sp. NPDC004629]|uniref:hypothetical protein n=1 Tax=Streptomyces sp. NPDC004629 TaxID=3364705 RepID=UPI00368B01BA
MDLAGAVPDSLARPPRPSRTGPVVEGFEAAHPAIKEELTAAWAGRRARRELLPRSADAAATTLAFFDAAEQAAATDLRLGHVRADHVRVGLEDSGITCPPVDRDLVFHHLDHCVTRDLLPAPGRRHGHRSGVPADSPQVPGTRGHFAPTTATEPFRPRAHP